MAYNWTSSTIIPCPPNDVINSSSLVALDADKLFLFFGDYDSSNGGYFTKSTDGGNTWSTLLNIDHDAAYNIGSKRMWVSPDGNTIYLIHTYEHQLLFRKSINGGSSFNSPAVIQTYDEGQWESPAMDVYGTSGQYIYCIYDGYDGAHDWDHWYKLAYSEDYGATWIKKDIVETYANLGMPKDIKVIDLNTIYVCANLEPVSGGGIWGLYFAKTIDKGNTWDISTVTTDHFGWTQSMYVKDSNNIYIVYEYYSTGLKQPYFAKSINSGSSFSTPVPIDTSSTSVWGYFPNIQSPDDGTTLMVSYYDYNSNNAHLKFAISTDLGVTWITEVADSFAKCGDFSCLQIVNPYIFIVHDFLSGIEQGIRLTKTTISSYPPADPIDDNPDTLPDPGGDPQEIVFRTETYKAIRSERD